MDRSPAAPAASSWLRRRPISTFFDAFSWIALAAGIGLALGNSAPSAAAMLIVLAGRRLLRGATYPLVVAAGVGGAFIFDPLQTGPYGDPRFGHLGPSFALVIAAGCYLTERHSSRWWWPIAPLAAGAAVLASETVLRLRYPSRDFGEAPDLDPWLYIGGAVLGISFGLAANALDKSRRLETETKSLRTRTEASEEHGRWLELRTQLARELHDLVGHHVTAMVVQAEAGLVGDPRAALSDIGDSGRRALTELDSLVHYLRDPTSGGLLTAVQRLENIDALAKPLEHRGVDVDITVADSLDLEPPVELAVYRIVQEALTNVARHSHATNPWVSVEAAGTHVHVRVSDDGVGPPDEQSRGTGLAGIAERVAAHGGVWTVGVRHGGGTTLDAYLLRGEVDQ